MGSIASGIFDLLSGNPAQSEQNEFGSLADYGINTGEGAENAANQYYSGILSGNPEEIAQTLAPEIRAGNQQLEQTDLTNSMFGNRGGGTNAATQAAKSNERGNIINLIGGLQQGAAGAEAGIGSNMLGLGSNSLSNEANLALGNQQRESGAIGGIAQGAAELAMPFLAGAGAEAGSMVEPFSSINGTANPIEDEEYSTPMDLSGLEDSAGPPKIQ